MFPSKVHITEHTDKMHDSSMLQHRVFPYIILQDVVRVSQAEVLTSHTGNGWSETSHQDAVTLSVLRAVNRDATYSAVF